MKFAICNETYQGWSFDRICEDAATQGYDGVEIAPFTLADDPTSLAERDAEQLRRDAERANLEIVGLHWLLLKPAGLHFTSPDEPTRQRTVAFLQHLARLCAAMGGSVMVFGSPKQRAVTEGEPPRAAFDRAVAGLREVCDVAHPLGVTFAFEPLAPTENTFITTAGEGAELLAAVDHPGCRLHLDVKAMCSESDPVPRIIERHADLLAHFHANDANMRGPGFGDVDFVPIMAALQRVGYDGYVSVEVFDYTPDARTIARESLQCLRRALAAGKR